MSEQSVDLFLAERSKFVEKCLLALIRGDQSFEGIEPGEKQGKRFVECTAKRLNECIIKISENENREYEASTPQLSALFTAKGGILFKGGWRRIFVRAVRGLRTYRFVAP